MEGVPFVSRCFDGCDYGWYSYALPLDQASSSRVNEIFDIDFSERDSKALLK